jgi:hypothetical protein
VQELVRLQLREERVMPTDIASILIRKLEAEARATHDARTWTMIISLWAIFAGALSVLIFKEGFDPLLAEALIFAG